MPQPVIAYHQDRILSGFATGVPETYSSSSSASVVAMMNLPPVGIASRALTTRFISILFNLTRVGFDAAQRNGRPELNFDVLADQSQNIVVVLFTTSFRSSILGNTTCFRLNARSC